MRWPRRPQGTITDATYHIQSREGHSIVIHKPLHTFGYFSAYLWILHTYLLRHVAQMRKVCTMHFLTYFCSHFRQIVCELFGQMPSLCVCCSHAPEEPKNNWRKTCYTCHTRLGPPAFPSYHHSVPCSAWLAYLPHPSKKPVLWAKGGLTSGRTRGLFTAAERGRDGKGIPNGHVLHFFFASLHACILYLLSFGSFLTWGGEGCLGRDGGRGTRSPFPFFCIPHLCFWGVAPPSLTRVPPEICSKPTAREEERVILTSHLPICPFEKVAFCKLGCWCVENEW